MPTSASSPAAAARGLVVTLIERGRLSLFIDAENPAMLLDGLALPRFDAVLSRSGRAPTAFAVAIVRQLSAAVQVRLEHA